MSSRGKGSNKEPMPYVRKFGHSEDREGKRDGKRRHRDRSNSAEKDRRRSPADRDKRRRSRSPRRRRSRSIERERFIRRESKRSRSPDSRRKRSRSRSPRSDRAERRRRHDIKSSPKSPVRGDDFPPSKYDSMEDKKPNIQESRWGNSPVQEKPSASKEEEPVSKPSFVPSGKLAADTNTFKGVVIKYNEPDEAAVPKTRWRLYPMREEEVMKPFYIHRQSAFLVGRDRKIADFPVDHPSCSKQHAVLQYRSMPFERNGVPGRRTLPYIIDLESANGTYLNGDRIDPRRYYELKEKDVIKFGFSSREYVLLHEQSAEGKGNLDEEIDEDDEIDDTGVEEKMAGVDEDYF